MAKLDAGRILIVDDDPDMLALLQTLLDQDGFRTDGCSSLEAMKAKILRYSYDGILLDLFLGDETSLSALPFLVRETPHSKVIVMTAHGSIELAVESMDMGATSFVTKSEDPYRITEEVKRRLSKPQQTQMKVSGLADLNLIGQSEAMQALFDDILSIKDSDATVLIQGESGTGKELVARAIHRLSPRRDELFAALNCAAIPENLLESELFGHKKGSFTDAKMDRKGIFESCSKGTLFLDEIGDMPLSLQSKMLRVLQEKEITPIGGSKPIAINTRIVAATHRDLEDEVMRSRFREDLYFRLNVFSLYIPPLRERKGDIPLLIQTFIKSFNARYGKNVRFPSAEMLRKLEAYTWPGNVRELQNSIERAVVLAKDDQLKLEDVLKRKVTKTSAGDEPTHGMSFSYNEAKENFERTFLLNILKAAKGSIAEAARLSGRYRSDIYRLLERYGIQVDEFKS